MRRFVLVGALALAATAGCSSSGSSSVRHAEAPANVTYPIAFGDYKRVYNCAYHVVNKYGVVKKASYRSGEIEAEINQDNSLFDKTRRTILARIFDAGDYWDVECRVLIAIEDSDVETLGEFQPKYRWRTIASDSQLETRLNNEIKRALSGGAFESKQPLAPEGKSAGPAAHPRIRITPGGEGEGASAPSEGKNLREARAVTPRTDESPEQEVERLGLKLMEKGLYAQAATAFRNATEKKGAPHAPYLLAHALFATGDYAGAAAAIREGASRNPGWARSRLDLRGFWGDPTDLKTQLAALEKHQHDQPADKSAALVLGYVAFFTADYVRARTVLDLLPKEDSVAESYRRLVAVEIDRAKGLEEF